MKDTPNCCICGEKVDEKINPVDGAVYWNQGESALPLKDGRCCTACADAYVLPARLEAHYQQQEHHNFYAPDTFVEWPE